MRVLSDTSPASTGLSLFWRRPVIWILAVCLLAMGGALGADYYMDDFMFITNSKGTAPASFYWVFFGQKYGSTAIDASGTSIFQLLPTLITLFNGWLLPLNPVADHTWNLLIHMTLAWLVFRCGERFLLRINLFSHVETRRQAAIAGALIFACHPLGTEPVHYAKCHMVQLVALFGFWATCETAEFFAQPNKKRAWKALALGGLCLISYFPGTVLLGFNLLLLSGFMWKNHPAGSPRRILPVAGYWKKPGTVLALAAGGAVVIYAGWYFLETFIYGVASSELWPVHVVTQGRVFWEYVARIFVPVHLTSDHYQPWSTFKDPVAVAGLVLFALLATGSFVAALAGRPGNRRGIFLLLSLVLIPFAMRLLYTNIEIMVEYRAYNALPWISLLAGCGLAALAQKPGFTRLRWLPAGALILVFTLLPSASRGVVWRSGERLARNVLEQYPLNNRARTQLESFDLDAGRYAEVLQRHGEILAVRDQITALNAQSGGRRIIDPIRADDNVIGSYQFAVMAWAEIHGCEEGLKFADAAIAELKQKLPGHFEDPDGDSLTGAWPLLEARAAVQRALDSGYQGGKAQGAAAAAPALQP